MTCSGDLTLKIWSWRSSAFVVDLNADLIINSHYVVMNRSEPLNVHTDNNTHSQWHSSVMDHNKVFIILLCPWKSYWKSSLDRCSCMLPTLLGTCLSTIHWWSMVFLCISFSARSGGGINLAPGAWIQLITMKRLIQIQLLRSDFLFNSLWYLCTLLLAIYHLTQIQNYRQIGLELISWISCRYMRMTTLLDLFRILLKQSRTQQVKVRIGDPFLAYSFIFLAHICRFFCDTKF